LSHLTIGDTVIPFNVRASTRARRKRIVVTPGRVEVVVPPGTPADGPDGVRAYVEAKRRWVFDAVREIDERHRALLAQRYASGAKLQLRGRWLMLDVQEADVEEVAITCRSRFHVAVPRTLVAGERLEALRAAFDRWLQLRAKDDVERLGRLHAGRLGVEAAGYRLSDAKSRWGSCGKDRVVRVHWRLVQAPLGALEYVVAHEVAHLLHRNHGPAFWAAVGRTLPEWRERKALLERWEGERRAV
jgi:hypothetical protein